MGDKPLIDLEALLHCTDTGQEGSSDNGSFVTPTPIPIVGEDDPNTPEPPTIEPIDSDDIYTIEIVNNMIICDEQTFIYDKATNSIKERSVQALATAIGNRSGKEILIQLDYAEAHAFRFVKAYLMSNYADSILVFEPEFDSNWGVTK